MWKRALVRRVNARLKALTHVRELTAHCAPPRSVARFECEMLGEMCAFCWEFGWESVAIEMIHIRYRKGKLYAKYSSLHNNLIRIVIIINVCSVRNAGICRIP